MDDKNLFQADDEILGDIESINTMIVNEKSKQSREVAKEKKEKEIEEAMPLMEEENTQVVKEVVTYDETMERLHLRIMGDTIDVLYRPNHSYVSFLPNDENGKAEVKRLAEMSRDEFRAYLEKSTCFSFPTKAKVEEMRTSNAENWYKGAWSMSTKKLLDEVCATNPVELPIVVGG